MKSEHICAYFQDQMVSFEKNLIESAFLSEKAIHQLRVSIKKLRALMNLVENHTSYPNQFLYQFKQVTSVFKPLGKIRDNRNKAKLINYYFSNEKELMDRLNGDLDQKLRLATDAYQDKFLTYSFESFFLFKTEFDHFLRSKLGNIKSREAARDIVVVISELMKKEDLKSKLHKIRSYVKELLFILQIFKTKQIDINGKEYGMSDLATLGEYLGQWHDYELLINLYNKVNEQLHEPTTYQFEKIQLKSEELFRYVSNRLYVQFSLI